MKNSIKSLLIACMILPMITTTTHAQKIEKMVDGRYLHEGKTYEYKQMEEVFSQNITAQSYYKKAIKKQKTSKVFGIIALSSAVVGGISLAAYQEPKSCSARSDNFLTSFGNSLSCSLDKTGQLIIPAFTLGLIMPITGITALIVGGKAKKNRKRSMESFNQEYGIVIPNKHKPNLELVVGNGLGLQFTF